MIHVVDSGESDQRIDTGLRALCAIAGFYRIPTDADYLARELAIENRSAKADDLLRAARLSGLKARIVLQPTAKRLQSVPVPAIACLADGKFTVYSGITPTGHYRFVDPVTRTIQDLPLASILAEIGDGLILIQRRFRGTGANPATFGFRWFFPSIWRYRRPIGHVLLASLFVQLFALVTPLFFQVIVDKVLVHKAYSTLFVIIAALAIVGFFDITLQYLRTYALSHTTNRIDVELGKRLFHHLLALPLTYFETRPAGQTVARMRELETIRSFLTGQGLFSGIDLVFTTIFIAVLFTYSTKLALIIVATIPLYLAISALVRPSLKDRINEKFNRGAESQQFLVESVVGIQTLKASAVEPSMRIQWEERLASYVRTAFDTTMLASAGQNAIQFVNKLSTAAIMLFGAKAAIDGELTVGELVAFNMIASQVAQPILRLSQFWQDFQQIQVSIERLGDILNTPPEQTFSVCAGLPPPRGAIEIRDVSFSYRLGGRPVLRNTSLRINSGEVIGIVGASGSGKSTLTKLIQRLYLPGDGQILIDGVDISQVDPAWLRVNIGVVLQESLLFNRTIHDNIAFANPAMSRATVMNMAKLSGAEEFINRLPRGYDTMIEERGANLSGGQRQRIAIARALATNPPILILDEATSALDYESERIVQDNMRRICSGRTVIIIAHRLAAVRGCNRIIGMSDGRIVEAGSHDELLRSPSSIYRRLWVLQTAGAKEAVA